MTNNSVELFEQMYTVRLLTQNPTHEKDTQLNYRSWVPELNKLK